MEMLVGVQPRLPTPWFQSHRECFLQWKPRVLGSDRVSWAHQIIVTINVGICHAHADTISLQSVLIFRVCSTHPKKSRSLYCGLHIPTAPRRRLSSYSCQILVSAADQQPRFSHDGKVESLSDSPVRIKSPLSRICNRSSNYFSLSHELYPLNRNLFPLTTACVRISLPVP